MGWLASVHRVRNLPAQSTRKLSMAYFVSPRDDAIIEPLLTCVEDGMVPKYAPAKVRDFMYQRHLLHIPPEQRKPEERDIPKEFWEAATAANRSQTLMTGPTSSQIASAQTAKSYTKKLIS